MSEGRIQRVAFRIGWLIMLVGGVVCVAGVDWVAHWVIDGLRGWAQ